MADAITALERQGHTGTINASEAAQLQTLEAEFQQQPKLADLYSSRPTDHSGFFDVFFVDQMYVSGNSVDVLPAEFITDNISSFGPYLGSGRRSYVDWYANIVTTFAPPPTLPYIANSPSPDILSDYLENPIRGPASGGAAYGSEASLIGSTGIAIVAGAYGN